MATHTTGTPTIDSEQWIQMVSFTLGPNTGILDLTLGPPRFESGAQIDDESIIALGDRIWIHALGMGRALGDIDLSAIRLGRTRISSYRKGSRYPHASAKRSVGSIDRFDHQWPTINILLHLRGWQFDRDLYDDYLDLYITPQRGLYDDVSDDATAGAEEYIRQCKGLLEDTVSQIVKIATNDPDCRVKFDDPVWREECMPKIGSDAFNLGGLLVGDRSTGIHVEDSGDHQ